MLPEPMSTRATDVGRKKEGFPPGVYKGNEARTIPSGVEVGGEAQTSRHPNCGNINFFCL